MSSRQEEKQRRKAERAEAEAKAAKSAAVKSRLQLALGGLVGVAALVVAVLIFSGSGGGSDDNVGEPPTGVALPAQKETNLQTAAKTAGCTLASPTSEGRGHTTKKVVYKTNPPTSGAHNPQWSEDGIYTAENTPPLGMLVHTLEHGRVDIQYKPGTPAAMVEKLEALGSEELRFGREGYHTLVFQNPTDMEPEVAATAWTQSLTCPTMNDDVYDAVRAFRVAYTDKGPELIP